MTPPPGRKPCEVVPSAAGRCSEGTPSCIADHRLRLHAPPPVDAETGRPDEPTLTGEPNAEPWVIYEGVRRIVYGPAGFDDVEDEWERRNDPELGTMPAPAPSPSQPEPGTRRHLPDCPLPRLIASCTCPTPPAPPAVPGDRPATELAPAMHVIRRADGDEMGEFAFFATDGPDGWDVAENTDHDEDTVYEILACYPVARRKMLCSTLCPTCDGEGEDGIGTMCPSCGGSGEHEAPDAEHLMIHVYADAQPAHPAPDGDELRNLRRWKSEATIVLDTWDKVHEALGSPGLLGEHKSSASLAEIERRTAAMRQLIDDIAPPGGYGVADGTPE